MRFDTPSRPPHGDSWVVRVLGPAMYPGGPPVIAGMRRCEHGIEALAVTPEQAVIRSNAPGGIVEKAASFDWLSSDEGVLRWIESLPSTGRAVQVTWYADGRASETFAFATAGLGSPLHAYGANPYADSLAWVNASDGQVYGPGHRRLTNSNHV